MQPRRTAKPPANPQSRSSKIISPTNSSNVKNNQNSNSNTSTNSTSFSESTAKYNEFGSYPIVRTFPREYRHQIEQLTIVYDDSRCFNVVFSVSKDPTNKKGSKTGAVYSFGDNSSGCLGLGHSNPVYDQPQPIKELGGKQIVHLVSGNQFVLAMDSGGECWSWGRNSHGQLGLEIEPAEINRVTIPQRLSLPFTTNSKSENSVLDIVCGNAFVAMLTTNGDVYTSGQNNFGQLGLSDLDYRLEFSQINLLDTISVISCGANHLLMVTNDGSKVYACGDNRYGQLGVKMAEKVIITPVVVGSILLKNGLLRVRTVACGANYSLVLLSNGVIYSFGENSAGQLGHLSMHRCSATPRSVDLFEFSIAIYTTNLGNLSVAKSGAGRLFCWGPIRKTRNYQRQLDWIDQQKYTVPPPPPLRSRSVIRVSGVENSGKQKPGSSSTGKNKPKSPLAPLIAEWNAKANQNSNSAKQRSGAVPKSSSNKQDQSSKDQLTSKNCYIFHRPSKAYCMSVQKLFAMYEPMGLSCGKICTGKWEPKKEHNGRPCTDRKTFNQRNKSDVYFKVGKESLLAHRSVLATYSEYFHRIFRFAPTAHHTQQNNSNQCASSSNSSAQGASSSASASSASSNASNVSTAPTNSSKMSSSFGSESSIIPIRDFEPDTYRLYLTYLYTGSIYERNFKANLRQDSEWLQNLGELLELAVIYEESDMMEHLMEEIAGKTDGKSENNDTILRPNTVILLYSVAIEYQLEKLIEICVEFITTHWSEMLKQPDFEALRKSVLNYGEGAGEGGANNEDNKPRKKSNESIPIQMQEQCHL